MHNSFVLLSCILRSEFIFLDIETNFDNIEFQLPGIFSFEMIYFIVQIKYYKFKSIFSATSFKILNDVTLCTLSIIRNVNILSLS